VCKEKFHEFTQSVMDEIDIMAAATPGSRTSNTTVGGAGE